MSYHLRRLHSVILISAASASIILAIAILANNNNNTEGNYGSQQSPSSAFAAGASEQLSSAANNSNDTELPPDYDNLTTFELFEKYPDVADINKAPVANKTAASNTTIHEPTLVNNNTASTATTDSLRQEMEELRSAAEDNLLAEYHSYRNVTAASSPPSHPSIKNITETVKSLQQTVSTMNKTVNSLDRVADKLDSAASELHIAASNLNNAADSLNASSLSASVSSAEATTTEDNNESTAQNSVPPINITITANPSANFSPDQQHQSQMTLDENGSRIDNIITSGTEDNAQQNDKSQLLDNSNSSSSSNDLIISSAKRLTGELEDGDYLIIADLSPYRTIQGSSHFALKVPCNNQGEPKVALLTGDASDSLRETDLGEALGQDDIAIKGSSNVDEIRLSDNGDYCLYNTALPAGISDILIVNDSGDTIDFSDGRYYVALTVKATD